MITDKYQLLDDWLKEIKILEYRIKNEKKQNKRILYQKRLHLILLNIRKFIPIIIGVSLSMTISEILFSIGIESEKKFLYTKKEINDLGQIAIVSNYQKTNQKTNYIEEYGKWILLPNHQYQRTIKIYHLNMRNYTNEQILNIITKESNILDNLNKDNVYTRTETSSFLSESEINASPKITAYLYQKNTDNFITYQITNKDIRNKIILSSFLSAMITITATVIRNTTTNFDYLKEKDNYNFIKGDNNE